MANFDIIYRIASDLSGLTKGVEDTARSTQAIDDKMKGLQGSVAGLGKDLLALFAADKIGSAILTFSKQVIDLGSHLTDLRQKTGIGLEGLQLMKVAGEQSGVQLDTLATAANKLGVALAGGGAGVAMAVQKLGLSLADLKKGAPEDNIFTIAKAFDTIENPADRAKIAMTLFGKAGLELLPVLNGQFAETAEAAKRVGVVIGDDVLEAADKFDDQMVVVRASLTKFVADALAPMLPGMLELAQDLASLATGATTFGRAMADWVVGVVLRAQQAFFDFILVTQELATKVPFLAKQIGITADTLALARENAAHAADTLRIFTEDTAKAREGVDAHTAAVRRQLPIIGDWSTQIDEAGKKAKAMAEAQAAILAAAVPLTAVQRDQILAWHDLGVSAGTMATALGISDVAVSTFVRTLELCREKIQAVGIQGLDLRTLPLGFIESGPAIDAMTANLQNNMLPAITNITGIALPAVKASTLEWGQIWDQVGNTITGNLAQALTGAKSFSQAFSDIWHSLMTDLLGALTQKFLKGVLDSLSGSKGGVTQAFSGAFSGFGGVLSGLTSAMTGWVGWATAAIAGIAALWGGIKSLFGGGEEGTVVNPERDKWFNAHGGSVASVGELLAPFMDGNQAQALIGAVFAAKTDADFKKASGAIDAILSGGGVPALAAGGIVTRPMFAQIGDNPAGEAVIPLDRLQDMTGAAASARVSAGLDGVAARVGRLEAYFQTGFHADLTRALRDELQTVIVR